MIVKWVRNSAWFYMRAKDIYGQAFSLREAAETYHKFVNEFCAKYNTTMDDEQRAGQSTTPEEDFILIQLACPEAVRCILP